MACTDTVWCESCAVRLDSKCMTAQRKLVCQCHPCQVTQWNYWNNCGNSALQKTEEAKKVKREGDRNGGEKQGWTDRQSPDGECRSQGIFPIMMFPLTTGTWSCWKPSFFSIRSVSSIPAHANVVLATAATVIPEGNVRRGNVRNWKVYFYFLEIQNDGKDSFFLKLDFLTLTDSCI